MVPNKVTEAEALVEFYKWLKPIEYRTIAGENPGFDLDHLMAGTKRHGMPWTLGYRTIDLHTIAYNSYDVVRKSGASKGEEERPRA